MGKQKHGKLAACNNECKPITTQSMQPIFIQNPTTGQLTILPQQRCGFKKSRNREKRRSRSRKYFRCEAKNDENIKLWIAGTGFIPTGTIPTQCHCVRIKNNTV